MFKISISVIGTLLAIGLGGISLARGGPEAAFPITITDDGGARLTLTSRPMRIVSLTPANTEMLFAIGAGPCVVGDTTSCDYPPAAINIAKIGGFIPNYERIVSLRPDLVVTDDIA